MGGGRHCLERADISRFFAALLSGRIVSDESLAEMKQTVVVDGGPTGDGLGIFSTDLSCGRFLGHDDGILDYGTVVKASRRAWTDSWDPDELLAPVVDG